MVTQLGTLGGASSEALALNDAGEVVGIAQNALGAWRGFRWTGTDGMQELGTLGGRDSRAVAINAVGQIVGAAQTVDGAWHAVVWDPQGLIDLGTLGGPGSRALAINDVGQVVGEAQTADGAWHAFIWAAQPGLQDLGTLGGRHSRAWDVGAAGQAVGEAHTPAGTAHAFVWERTTGLRDLGTRGGAGSRAVAITAAGRILGEAQDAAGRWQPVVWADQDPAEPGRRWLPWNAAALSSPAVPVVAVTAADAVSTAFVAALYPRFYGREGQSADIDSWAMQIDDCRLTPAQVVAALAADPELTDIAAPVARLYTATFLRSPERAGLDFWVYEYRAGRQTLASIAEFFASSPELIARYGELSNREFVTVIYQNVMGREPDVAGLEFWVAQMESGMTRGVVLLLFSDSPEYRERTARDVEIFLLYYGLTDRMPTTAELAAGQTESLDALITELLQSSDYRGATVPVPVCGDNQPPAVNAGLDQTLTLPATANLSGTVTDDGLPNPPATVTVTWSPLSGPGTVTFGNGHAADTTATFSAAGAYVLRLTANDSALNGTDEVTITVNPAGGGEGLPPDPSTVAPPVDPTVATPISDATEFLYTGANPIQTGVTPGTIDPARVAVLRGQVLDKSNALLSGVTITILNHPEFGQTLSRADGAFDLAVNGGGLLTVIYQKTGYLPAQRQINAPWQDYVIVDEVVLVAKDAKVTTINLSNATTLQAAQGSVVTDQDGVRQPALLLPAGVTASKVMPDGSTQPLSTLSLRFSEYTVGANGPQTMPASLPANVGYTYALELSADEATTKLNGKDVLFNQPVPFYVDNFLNFPVGSAVPVGYYDSTKGAWIPSDSGRVINLLSVSSGKADLDVTGDGTVADAAALAELGITDEERAKLATLYPVGKSLWRVQLTHLSTWDCNWPFGPPDDAKGPPSGRPSSGPPNSCGAGGENTVSGSVIGCESQTLGERIPLVGTDLALNYRSDRVPGRTEARNLKITLSGATVPASLKRIEASVQVAGRNIDLGTFPAQANQATTFTWDGQNAYGQALQGSQAATVKIGYVYDGVYQQGTRFGYNGNGTPITGSRTRQEITFSSSLTTSVGSLDLKQAGIAGWSLDIHHAYDLAGHVLYQGDGIRRIGQSPQQQIITTVAGVTRSGYDYGYSGDGGPATQAQLSAPKGVTVAADGSFYIADKSNNRIRWVDANGTITTVAGTGSPGFSGDSGPATQAQLNEPSDVALASDGSFYIADAGNNRIRRVDVMNGTITTVAGTGSPGFSGDSGPATQAQLNWPNGIAVASDGSFYIADTGNNRIRWVENGTITRVAGDRLGFNIGTGGDIGDGGPAIQSYLNKPRDIAVAADGRLYIADTDGDRIRRVENGVITTVAGTGSAEFSGDGGSATQANISRPQDVAVTADGGFYIADTRNNRIRWVDANGAITTVAGTGALGFSGDGGPATQAPISGIQGVARMVDGSLLIVDTGRHRIRKVSSAFPGFTNVGEFAIASEDGRQLYRFSAGGRHLSTVDTLTDTVLYTFAYDSAGRLSTVTDADGNVITVERDGNGHPTALVAPFGQRTTLTVDGNGYLNRVTNPASEAYQMAYTADGLLTHFTDPRNNASQFTYDALGRLQRDANAASGSQNLARTEREDGYTVTRTTALNRATAYSVDDLSTGDRRRKVVTPDGLQTQTLLGTNGSANVTEPDGTVTESLDGPDPRFGMQSPITTSNKVTTGGITATTGSTATVEPANPTNPLDFTTLTRTTTINGRTSTSVYDKATRKTTVTSDAQRQRYSILDDKGRMTEAGVTGLEPITIGYDGRGRLNGLAQGSGADTRTTTFSYNAAGYLASATDALGQSSQLDYDNAGRVIAQTLANGQQIDFGYDAKGNLTSLTPPDQPAHSFTYNAVDLATSYIPPTVPGGGDTGYEYNADKQLTKVTRPDGGVLSYAYDAAGRLSTLTLPAGQYGYSYNAAGQLSGIAAPGGLTLANGYAGSLLTGVTWSGGISGSVEFGYDNDFRIASLTVNSADPIAYAYDPDSLLTTAGDLTLTRNAQNGLLTGSALGNANDTYTYNSFGEPTAYTARYNSTNLLNIAYTHDRLGRITQKVETVSGGAAVTFDYGYDAIGRLIEVKRNSAAFASYVYDANGNRTSRTAGSTVNGTYDAQDRLLTYGNATYAYTANGELKTKDIGGQTTTYNYDALGNLRNVTLAGKQIEYLIDGRNRRVGKKVGGTLVQGFLYQSTLKPIAELDGTGNMVSRFVYADQANVPDYLIKNGQTYRIVTDHLGSPRLVINTGTGTIEQTMEYDEFGRVLSDSNPGFQPFGFAGGLYDRDTGLVRFGARDYDAETGRWTAKDPIGFTEEDTNLYQYVLNDPINLADREGLQPTGVNKSPPVVGPVNENKELQKEAANRACDSVAPDSKSVVKNWKKANSELNGGGRNDPPKEPTKCDTACEEKVKKIANTGLPPRGGTGSSP